MKTFNRKFLVITFLTCLIGTQASHASMPWEQNESSTYASSSEKTLSDIGKKILVPLKSLSCSGKDLISNDWDSTGIKVNATLSDDLSCEIIKASSIKGKLEFTINEVGSVHTEHIGNRNCFSSRYYFQTCTEVYMDIQTLSVSNILNGQKRKIVLYNYISSFTKKVTW